MTPPTTTREEFNARLAQSIERMRHKRLTLEAQAAELEDLFAQYSAVLERLELGEEQRQGAPAVRRDNLRNLLIELAGRTLAVAKSL